MAPPTVTLTFDNGPTPGVTDRVLDVLAARRLLATFFVVGNRLARPGARALAERAVAEGHWIGNHSATHRTALGSLDDPAAIDAEIDDCERLLDGLRHADRLFRPFGNGGAIDDRMLGAHAVGRLVDGGYTCVLWSSVPHDWDDPTGWVSRAVDDVVATDHTVLVLHDTPGACVDRLDELLDLLTELGVTFEQSFPDSCVPLRRGVPTSSWGTFGVRALAPDLYASEPFWAAAEAAAKAETSAQRAERRHAEADVDRWMDGLR